jgi:hypothetical protein
LEGRPVSAIGEQPDIAVSSSQIAPSSGPLKVDEIFPDAEAVDCGLENGYRRFKDNDMRRSCVIVVGLSAGNLNGFFGFSRSDGDDGFDETSVKVLFRETVLVWVADAMVVANGRERRGLGQKKDVPSHNKEGKIEKPKIDATRQKDN